MERLGSNKLRDLPLRVRYFLDLNSNWRCKYLVTSQLERRVRETMLFLWDIDAQISNG